jgi:hypothetical protein
MLAINQIMLNGASNEGDVVVTPIGFKQAACDFSSHFITWNAGTAAGVVSIEQADSETSPDEEWVVEGTVTFSGTAPKTDVFKITGAHGAIRHRVAEMIESGTVTTRIVGRA